MAFFLVTHTRVIEADDEAAAASKVVGDIRAGGPVSVTVKADEVTVRAVTVPAEVCLKQPAEARTDDGKQANLKEIPPPEPDRPGCRLGGFRPLVSVAVLATLSAMLGYIRFRG